MDFIKFFWLRRSETSASPRRVKSFCFFTFLCFLLLFSQCVYAMPSDWAEPSSDPPSGNIAVPINQGPTSQAKSGSLVVGSGDANIVGTSALKVVGTASFENANFSGTLTANSGSSFLLQGTAKIKLEAGTQITGVSDTSMIDLSSTGGVNSSVIYIISSVGTGIYTGSQNGTGIFSETEEGTSIFGKTKSGVGVWGKSMETTGLAGKFEGGVMFKNQANNKTTTIDGYVYAPNGLTTIAQTDITGDVYQNNSVVTQNLCFVKNNTLVCRNAFPGPGDADNFIFNSESIVGTQVDASIDIDGSINTGGSITLGNGINKKVKIQPSEAVGDWTLKLPNSAGSPNQVLQTNGNGTTSWATVSGGGSLSGGVSSTIPIWTSPSTIGNSNIYQSGVKIGVGVSSPQYKLSLGGSNDQIGFYQDATHYSNIKLYNSADGGMYFDNRNPSTGGYNWQVAGLNKMVLTQAGNVGIGTTNPNKLLHVYKTTGDNAEIDIQSVAGTNEHWSIYHDRNSKDLRFWNNSLNVLSMTSSGDVGVGGKATITSAGIIKSEDLKGTANRCLYATSSGVVTATTTDCGAGGSGGSLSGGTTNYVPLWTSPSMIGNSNIYQGTAGNSTQPAKYIGIGTMISSLTVPGDFSMGSSNAMLQLTGNGTHDVGLFLRKSDNSVGIDIWSDSSTNDVYIDSRNNNNESDIIFRTKTNATILPPPVFIIKGSGKIGIGTTVPDTALHIRTAAVETSAEISLQTGYIPKWGIYQIGTGATPGDLRFWSGYDGGGNKVTFTRDGKVGIGTISPAAKLEVSGDVLMSGNVGIGITPTAKLHVNGDVLISGGGDLDIVGGDINITTGNELCIGTTCLNESNMKLQCPPKKVRVYTNNSADVYLVYSNCQASVYGVTLNSPRIAIFDGVSSNMNNLKNISSIDADEICKEFGLGNPGGMTFSANVKQSATFFNTTPLNTNGDINWVQTPPNGWWNSIESLNCGHSL